MPLVQDLQEKPEGASIPELSKDWQVSESTLYSLKSRNLLPGARRLGKRIVAHRKRFEEWMKDGQGKKLQNAAPVLSEMAL